MIGKGKIAKKLFAKEKILLVFTAFFVLSATLSVFSPAIVGAEGEGATASDSDALSQEDKKAIEEAEEASKPIESKSSFAELQRRAQDCYYYDIDADGNFIIPGPDHTYINAGVDRIGDDGTPLIFRSVANSIASPNQTVLTALSDKLGIDPKNNQDFINTLRGNVVDMPDWLNNVYGVLTFVNPVTGLVYFGGLEVVNNSAQDIALRKLISARDGGIISDDEYEAIYQYAEFYSCYKAANDEMTEMVYSQCKEALNAGVFDGVICRMVMSIQDMSTFIMGIIGYFMEWRLLTDGSGSAGVIMSAWSMFLPYANVIFAIVFLIIIYSTATSIGLSNYSIKKIMPRLVLIAIAVNVSYYLCAALVDLSNIAGGSAISMFDSIINEFVLTTGIDPNNTSLLTTVSASFGSLGVIVVAVIFLVLFMIIFLLFGTVLIGLALCLRSVILTVLVVISPLAIAAAVLPNTQSLFKKWFKMFGQLLLIYPILMGVAGLCNFVSYVVMFTTSAGSDRFGSFSIVMNLFMMLLTAILPIVLVIPLMKKFGGVMGKVMAQVEAGAQKVAGAALTVGTAGIVGGPSAALKALPGFAGKAGEMVSGASKRAYATGKGPEFLQNLGEGITKGDGLAKYKTDLVEKSTTAEGRNYGTKRVKPSENSTDYYKSAHGSMKNQAREDMIKIHTEQMIADGIDTDTTKNGALWKIVRDDSADSDKRSAAIRLLGASAGNGDLFKADGLSDMSFKHIDGSGIDKDLTREAGNALFKNKSKNGFWTGADFGTYMREGGHAGFNNEVMSKNLANGEDLDLSELVNSKAANWQNANSLAADITLAADGITIDSSVVRDPKIYADIQRRTEAIAMNETLMSKMMADVNTREIMKMYQPTAAAQFATKYQQKPPTPAPNNNSGSGGGASPGSTP